MTRTHRDTLQAKRKRGLAKCDWHWLTTWPAWWDDMFHTRPARRKESLLLHDAKHGGDPVDWPDHRKPHKYFW